MKTSYENCHPEIAESLERGEHIRCTVWDNQSKHSDRTVVAYFDGGYISDTLVHYCNAEPAVRSRMIAPVALMKQFVKRGYKADRHGNWGNGKTAFPPYIFVDCGKEVNEREYPDWMLEPTQDLDCPHK